MQGSRLLSVVLPAYNEGEAIEHALAALGMLPGHQHLADRRAVQRRTPANTRVHAQHVARVDLVDVDDLAVDQHAVAVEDDKVEVGHAPMRSAKTEL